jgi:hypothetical protein
MFILNHQQIVRYKIKHSSDAYTRILNIGIVVIANNELLAFTTILMTFGTYYSKGVISKVIIGETFYNIRLDTQLPS